jgi:hypothetical protein
MDLTEGLKPKKGNALEYINDPAGQHDQHVDQRSHRGATQLGGRAQRMQPGGQLIAVP